MDVLLLEPYFAGSHRAWAEGYAAHSRHRVYVLSMPGRWWKWRMHGGAVTLAREFLAADLQPDLILATDMLDLTTFLALTRARTGGVPAAYYFHENQLTYPPPPGEKRDLHYGFVNYASALAADAVYFNSSFHMEDFFDELPRLLKHFPDYTELETIALLRERARVLPLGLDLRRFDAHRPHSPRDPSAPPLIVWNHRWEYDKNPAAFFDALYALAGEGVAFEVAVVGENFRRQPAEFDEARARLGERVVQFGYLESFEAYARLLWRADVQVSTAQQDFFGISTCEAIYCGCAPLLPRRLNYPALLHPMYHDRYLYGEGELVGALRRTLAAREASPRTLRGFVSQFDWAQMAPVYDEALAPLVPVEETREENHE